MSTAQEPDQQEEEQEQEEQEPFSFPVASPSKFLESPRLLWRRVPATANSSPTTRLELLRSKYQRRSFSCMETESIQMTMMMMTQDHHVRKDHRNYEEGDGHDLNKMDLLWEDLHELSKTKKYFDDQGDDEDMMMSSDLDQVVTEIINHQKKRVISLPMRRPPGTMAILKVLKKLFYVRKTGSTQSF